MDISASKLNQSTASCAIVVLDFKTKKVLFQKTKLVQLTQPYIPGFLAFREVDHLHNLLSDIKISNPEFFPDLIMVDGNGIYHSNGFGLACHIGVLSDVPCLGVSKTAFFVDGLSSNKVDLITEENLKKKTDFIYLKGDSGKIHGAAMKCSDENFNNYVIISQGHKLSLETACNVVKEFLWYRVVEPVRLADKLSRHEIKKYDKNTNIYN